MSAQTCTALFAEAMALEQDVRAFNNDPWEVNQEVVDRIKTRMRTRHNVPPHYTMRIAPCSTNPTMIVLHVTGDESHLQLCVDVHDNISMFQQMQAGTEQEEAQDDDVIFSTDLDHMIKKLTCDGGCECTFTLDSHVATTEDGRDYCMQCLPGVVATLPDFERMTAAARCSQYAQEQMQIANRMVKAMFHSP